MKIRNTYYTRVRFEVKTIRKTSLLFIVNGHARVCPAKLPTDRLVSRTIDMYGESRKIIINVYVNSVLLWIGYDVWFLAVFICMYD